MAKLWQEERLSLMSNFYAIYGSVLDGNFGHCIRKKGCGDSITIAVDSKDFHKHSLCPPYPTYTVSEDTIREWACVLNSWVREMDGIKEPKKVELLRGEEVLRIE